MGTSAANSPHVLEGRIILRHVIASDASPARRLVIAGLAALSGLAAYAVYSEASQGSALDAQVRSLTAQNGVLQQQITERQQQIGEANNVAWLEEQARRLGFVFPGETVYIITTPGAALPASGGVNAALPTFAPPTASPSSSSTAAPGSPAAASPGATSTPRPSPTPIIFVMPTPTAH
jgi:cell division protein FtsB